MDRGHLKYLFLIDVTVKSTQKFASSRVGRVVFHVVVIHSAEFRKISLGGSFNFKFSVLIQVMIN